MYLMTRRRKRNDNISKSKSTNCAITALSGPLKSLEYRKIWQSINIAVGSSRHSDENCGRLGDFKKINGAHVIIKDYMNQDRKRDIFVTKKDKEN